MLIYKVAEIHILSYVLSEDLDDVWGNFSISGCIENHEDIKCKIDFYPMHLDVINRDLKSMNFRPVEKAVMSNDRILLATSDYSYAYTQKASKDTYNVFLNYLFYSNVIQRKMLQMHCSMVEDKGRGILFLGPSGIGKTTQAERWAQYRNSLIINGDVGYVQQTEKGFIAWGTPWHGSSSYCVNTNVPLKALVVLKQAEKNKLRKLGGFEKVREVSGNIFYPTWMESGVELCTNTLNALLDSVPVYRLDNRADDEAVNLLAKEIDRIT